MTKPVDVSTLAGLAKQIEDNPEYGLAIRTPVVAAYLIAKRNATELRAAVLAGKADPIMALGQLAAAHVRAFEYAEPLVEPALKIAACTKGCSACCKQPVQTTLFEIMAGAAFTLGRVQAGERDETWPLRVVTQALDMHNQATRVNYPPPSSGMHDGGSEPEDGIIEPRPCAFLDPDGNCGVYPYRPGVCRGYMTQTRKECDDHLASGFREGRIGILEPARMVSINTSAGFSCGLIAAGLQECLTYIHIGVPELMAAGKGLDLAILIRKWWEGENIVEPGRNFTDDAMRQVLEGIEKDPLLEQFEAAYDAAQAKAKGQKESE